MAGVLLLILAAAMSYLSIKYPSAISPEVPKFDGKSLKSIRMEESISMNYELDWKKLIDFVGNDKEYEPKLRVPFSLDTIHLRQEFALDIVVWNLTSANLEQTKKVVYYILANFSRLFETAWTAHYHYYFDNVHCTLAEFYQKIDFEHPDHYTIRLELNSNYLTDNIARYHFVVATDNDLSEDNIRLYMRDNKCWGCDTNNEGMAILISANYEDVLIPEIAAAVEKDFEKIYAKMEEEQFLFAKSFGVNLTS